MQDPAHRSRRRRSAGANSASTATQVSSKRTTAPDSAFWITDFAFERVVYVSRGFEKLFGRSCASFYSDPWSLFAAVHPADRTRVVEHYARQKLGVPLDQEYRIIRPDGKIRWVWDKRSPMGDSSDQVYAGVAQDVTERKQSEQTLLRHSSVVQSASEAIISTTLEGVITAWNPAAETLFGYAAKEAIGSSIMLIVPPARSDEEGQLLDRVARGEQVGTVETQRLRRNGFVFDVALTLAPLREHGAIIGAAIICRDITREVAARTALLESERCFRETFDHSPVGLAHVSLDGQLVRVNQKLCEMTGYARELLLGQTLADIVDADDRAIDAVQFGDLITGKTASYTIEKRLVRRNEFPLWTELTISTAGLTDGVPNYLLVVVQDVSARRDLATQLRHAQKRQAMGQLACGIAHDFNNVLGYVTMRCELSSTYADLPPNVLADLQQIKAAANRATHLTRQLLAFCRNETSTRPQRLNLNELVNATMKMVQRLLGENLTLEVQLSPQPIVVNLDPGLIDQVLLNLAVNARDAMPNGGTVTIETTEYNVPDLESRPSPEITPGNYACLTVRDTGTGIEPENLPHIFEPFFTTKDPGRGTGLGLAMVSNLIRQNHGWITVESKVGSGTIFRVFLPALGADAVAAVVDLGSPKLEKGSETILLVEDEVDLRVTARMVLQLGGYNVLEAASGSEALSIWAKHRDEIALVFTDMVLPDGVNGRALAVQAQVDKPDVKVIFTTGYSPDVAGREITLHDGKNFLPKPYSIDRLLTVIRQSLTPNEIARQTVAS